MSLIRLKVNPTHPEKSVSKVLASASHYSIRKTSIWHGLSDRHDDQVGVVCSTPNAALVCILSWHKHVVAPPCRPLSFLVAAAGCP